MKKNIIMLLFVLITALAFSACTKVNKEPLNLPELSSIESVRISYINNPAFEVYDADWIEAFIGKANSAEFTSKKSIQDRPAFSEMIQIDLIKANNTESTLFVYEENGKHYIEQPYQGIYETDEDFIHLLTDNRPARIVEITESEFAIAAEISTTPTPVTAAENPTPSPEPSPTPTAESTEPEVQLMPSETAKKLGITTDIFSRIDGSTSTLQLVQQIYAKMFTTWVSFGDFPAEASKTMKSYEMLIAGDVDLILVPDPSQDILDKVAASKTGLEYIPIGAEALVFITHENNPTTNITKEQVQDIYTDMTINNWAQLGGSDGHIVPVCRNTDAGSQAQMDNLILEGKQMAPEIEENYMMYDMGGMIAQVEQYEQIQPGYDKNDYAIGYTMYYFINIYESTRGKTVIKPLAFNGIEPTPESILSKEYPLATNYYAVIRKDTPEYHSARKIVDWLITDEGQWHVADSGLGALRTVYEPPIN